MGNPRIVTVAASAIALLVGGCAAIVSDNESATYIGTDPENARCELHGQDFVRVVNTPASLQLPSAAAPITVSCQSEGYFTTTAKLDTEIDGWIFGNILLGGIIGIAIDAASGSGEKFPPQINIVLQPSEFASVQLRDDWFSVRRSAIESNWDEAIEKLESSCANSRTKPENCESMIEEAHNARREELAELDRNLPKSTIGTSLQSSSDDTGGMDPEVLSVILGRNGYESTADAIADYLTRDTDSAAAARFKALPVVAQDAIVLEASE